MELFCCYLVPYPNSIHVIITNLNLRKGEPRGVSYRGGRAREWRRVQSNVPVRQLKCTSKRSESHEFPIQKLLQQSAYREIGSSKSLSGTPKTERVRVRAWEHVVTFETYFLPPGRLDSYTPNFCTFNKYGLGRFRFTASFTQVSRKTCPYLFLQKPTNPNPYSLG